MFIEYRDSLGAVVLELNPDCGIYFADGYVYATDACNVDCRIPLSDVIVIHS